MTYAVFFYNMFLVVAYVVLAVVFFWLYRSRSSRLAWWLMVVFALSFFDNGFFFMKEIFGELGRIDPTVSLFYQAEESIFLAFYPFAIRMVTGYYFDDVPTRRSMIVLGTACVVAAVIGVASPPIPYTAFDYVSSALYAWVFLRLIPKAKGVTPRLVMIVLAALYVLDGLYRGLGFGIDLFWEERDLMLETCWAIYLVCAAYIAWTLLHTVEEPYLPSADVWFRRFLDAYGLSGREGEIAKLLMDGESNQDICNKLYIAAGTVKAHNHNIFKKLGIENRSQVLLKYTEYLETCAQESRLFR